MSIADHEIDEPRERWMSYCDIHGALRDDAFVCIGCACDEADRHLDSQRDERGME